MAGMERSPRFAGPVLCVLLAACAPVVAPPPPAPTVSDRQRLAEVHAVAGVDDTELNVQPLRDPQVEDLRAKAARALAAGDAAVAADALTQALLIVPDDPAVLQERAEVALLQGQYERADTLARRAYEVGSRVGPLCRRHWATIQQSLDARGQADNAAAAKAQIGHCTVPGVPRM
jgi:tetratricopeptide (TPR) repeat protein